MLDISLVIACNERRSLIKNAEKLLTLYRQGCATKDRETMPVKAADAPLERT